MTAAQRAKPHCLDGCAAARNTGTGLYNTILAAYRYQQAHYQAGVPNEVMLFTDGVNEDEPGSISRAQLKAALAAADPRKRRQMGIFAFGNRLPTGALPTRWPRSRARSTRCRVPERGRRGVRPRRFGRPDLLIPGRRPFAVGSTRRVLRNGPKRSIGASEALGR